MLALGPLAACSSDAGSHPKATLTAAQVRQRPCLLVTAAEVGAAVHHAVKATSSDGIPCTYAAARPDAASAVVELRTGAGKDDPVRLLPNGQAVEGLGSAARFDPQGGPLGARLVARQDGSLIIVDLGPAAGSDASAQRQAATIARAALRRAPQSKVGTTPHAAAGPCDRLGDGKALGKALDAAVTVTPIYPSGCSVSAPGRGNATVQVGPLDGKAAKVIGALERATDGKAWPKTAVAHLGDGAAWLADPTAPGAGQLTVATGDQLLTVTTDTSAGSSTAGRKLAVAVADAATG
ncbi:hypothetical protein [Aquihabitans sp. McL0605]|uniref:hypothetical protein n=1 Tax=Aquihabitans sp. McL0605 TaxID=3415671 RepID=UPI003CFA729A